MNSKRQTLIETALTLFYRNSICALRPIRPHALNSRNLTTERQFEQ
jgi:hypothetical protein